MSFFTGGRTIDIDKNCIKKAGGSALQTSVKLTNTGQKIALVGLSLQAASYGFFCILLVKSHISIKSRGVSLVHRPCIKLIWVLYFSSAFVVVSPPPIVPSFPVINPIQIRCIYRVIEFAQGYGGYLLTHESKSLGFFFPCPPSLEETSVFLYTLDTLPLVLAITVYIPFWPTKYIEQDNGKSSTETLEMNLGPRP